LPEKQPTPTGLKQDSKADSPGILAKTSWMQLLLVGRASSIMTDSVKCKLHIRTEVKQDALINCALFHFINGQFE
jgi:hypothetical protein